MSNKKIFQPWFQEALETHKQSTAIEYGSRHVSYGQLDRQTDSMAAALLNMNLQPGTFVGVYISNREFFIVTIIALLKARLVFVPLDAAQPVVRLQGMAEKAELNHVIADTGDSQGDSFLQYLQEKNIIVISVEHLMVDCAERDLLEALEYDGEDRIYVYFTSGSTGTPKAIVGKNKSLCHFINWEIQTFSLGSRSRVSQLITPGFDAFLRDVFAALCSGGTLCIPPEGHIMPDGSALAAWLDEQEIQLMHCVPSLFRLLNPAELEEKSLQNLNYILMSGEKIEAKDLNQWYAIMGDRIQLVNLYGPTETTMIKTYHLIKESDLQRERIPIGVPIKGARVIILDEEMNVCQPRITGEIFIRTPFGTHGYFRDDAANREKFISNPLSNDPKDIIFRTGDLGRFLTDGTIEFLGRRDRQVKIRGVRVELEEIEHTLRHLPQVDEAAVIIKKISKGKDILCALVTGSDGINDKDLTALLAEKLPAYMVPAQINVAETMPRKANGKMDYTAMEGIFNFDNFDYVAPVNKIQQQVADAWQEVLGIGRVGLGTGFFKLGGNSLNVLSLIALIHRHMDVRLTLADFFANDTVEKQARLVEERSADSDHQEANPKYTAIPPASKQKFYRVSSVQRRLFFMQHLDRENMSYNISLFITLEGDYNINKMEAVFRQLIDRHDSLRTSFHLEGEEPVQVIHDAGIPFSVNMIKPPVEKMSQEDILAIIHEFIRPFDPAQAPLMRIGVVEESGAKKKLTVMLDFHHIIFDASSQAIFVSEFMELYTCGNLESAALPLQYKDYSEWMNSEGQLLKVRRQGDYWQKRFEGPLPLLDLPNDFERPPGQTFDGGAVHYYIESHRKDSLKQLALDIDGTFYMVLLAIFNVFLGRLTGAADVIIGTSVAGRNHPDLQHIIGMFVNALPLRSFPAVEKSFLCFLKEVRENTLQDFENQDFQFEDLVDRTGVERIPGRNPLFDVMMVLNNEKQPETKLPGVVVNAFLYEKSTAQIDLKLRMNEIPGGRLFCIWEFRTDLYKRETVEMFGRNFLEVMDTVLRNPDTLIGDITLTHGLVSTKVDTSQMEFDF